MGDIAGNISIGVHEMHDGISSTQRLIAPKSPTSHSNSQQFTALTDDRLIAELSQRKKFDVILPGQHLNYVVHIAKSGIADITKLMGRDITLGIIGVVSKVAILVTLVVSVIFPLMIPFALRAVAATTTLLFLGTHIYKNKCVNIGIINAEYLNQIDQNS